MRASTRQRRKSEPPVEGWRLTVGYLGVMLCIIGFMLLMPLVLLPFHMDEIAYAHCFYAPGLAAVVLGWLGWETIHARPKAPLAPGQDATVIVLTWMLAMTVGALPFLLTGSCRTFTQAVFETMSGLSTTTFTVLDVERCPQLILLYRSALLFFGGIGLVLIMVSAISDAHGLRIYTQEGHANRLLPNLRRSALLVVRTYVLLIGVGTVLLTLCGMAPFDALNHAVGAVATGGFSTRNASVAAWDSPAIELVLAILMLLGGTNSATLVALLGGRWRTWWRDAETRAYLGCAAACTLLVAMILWAGSAIDSPLEALRASFFQVVSAETTTGFQTVSSFHGWPASARLVLIMAMVFGAESESTGGGIKQGRAAVLFRSVWWEVRRRGESRAVVHSDRMWQRGRRVAVSEDEQREALTFAFVYLVALVAGSFVYTLHGVPIGDAVFHFASALSTVGLGMGVTPADAPPVILWTTTLGMFVGRLEFYPVFVATGRAREAARQAFGR